MIVNKVDESGFSDNYQQLVELMKQRAIVCLVDYKCHPDGNEASRDIAKTTYSPSPSFEVTARGIGYIWANSEAEFINQCQRCNLKFLP